MRDGLRVGLKVWRIGRGYDDAGALRLNGLALDK